MHKNTISIRKNKKNCESIESVDFSFEYSPEVSEFDRYPYNRYCL